MFPNERPLLTGSGVFEKSLLALYVDKERGAMGS